MFRKSARVVLFACLALIFLIITRMSSADNTLAQIPTGSIPTVTGSPINAIVIVLQTEQGFANVRSGPGTLGYEIVGVLVEGQQVPALGRTAVGDWIMIDYPGVPGGVAWIWKDLVEVRGSIPVVEPPATMTPRVTPTIDPTLAAEFQVEIEPTRLPTYTAPPPLSIPTFQPEDTQANPSQLPIGLIIIGLAVVGLFGTLIAFLRGR